MRVLLVDDEVRLTDPLSYLLKKNQIEVDVSNDGDSALILAGRNVYDVIILDIMLPGKSGLEILQDIRNDGAATPVLLLTARGSVEDKVKGLNMGADDYLAKPFSAEELLARVKALARRATHDFFTGKYLLGNLEYNPASLGLKAGNRLMTLSSREGMLLEMFLKRPGQVFSREFILDRVWGYEAEIGENNIEVYIHNLRKKISTDTGLEIVTVRGIGYVLRETTHV